jgi:hypothetical protein
MRLGKALAGRGYFVQEISLVALGNNHCLGIFGRVELAQTVRKPTDTATKQFGLPSAFRGFAINYHKEF